MVCEIMIFLIHQPPGLNVNFTIKTDTNVTPYSLNMIITCISMVKLVIVFRTIFRYSKWGKASQIQSDTFGYRNTKKKPVPVISNASDKLDKKGEKTAKKAKARIQAQQRSVNLKPIELLQFSIKAELKEKPILVLSMFFFATLLVSAFILRATEMPAEESAGVPYNGGFKDYLNSIWCTFITVMTSKTFLEIYI